jgi:hypothetical protein
MRGLLIALMILRFFSCTAQDSNLPIDFNIKIEKEYFITRKKDYYSREIELHDYVVNSDSVRQIYFDVNVEIKNTSDRPISIWLMKCSFDRNFLVNNNYISMHGQQCDSNYPIQVKFQPGESKSYKLKLLKSIKFDYPCRHCVYGQQVESTKLGLIIVDNIFDNKFKGDDYELAMEDKSRWTIIWSNSLQLLGKQPQPKTLPIKRN